MSDYSSQLIEQRRILHQWPEEGVDRVLDYCIHCREAAQFWI